MNLVVISHLEPVLCGKQCCIYSIASYNFFVNRPLCFVINQQQWVHKVYFWEENTINCSQSLPCCQNAKGCRLWKTLTWNAQSLESWRSSLHQPLRNSFTLPPWKSLCRVLCKKILRSNWTKAEDTQCSFHPGRSTLKFLRNRASMPKTFTHVFVIKPDSSWKALGSVT